VSRTGTSQPRLTASVYSRQYGTAGAALGPPAAIRDNSENGRCAPTRSQGRPPALSGGGTAPDIPQAEGVRRERLALVSWPPPPNGRGRKSLSGFFLCWRLWPRNLQISQTGGRRAAPALVPQALAPKPQVGPDPCPGINPCPPIFRRMPPRAHSYRVAGENRDTAPLGGAARAPRRAL